MSTGSYPSTGRNPPEAVSSVYNTPQSAPSGSLLEFNSLTYTSSGSVKVSAGNVYICHVFNQSSGSIYFMLFNTGSIPTDNQNNFVDILPIPAGGAASLDWGTWGRFNSNGIGFICSAASASSSTAGNSPCRVSILYK